MRKFVTSSEFATIKANVIVPTILRTLERGGYTFSRLTAACRNANRKQIVDAVMSDVILKLLTSKSKYDPKKSKVSYFKTTALRVTLDYLANCSHERNFVSFDDDFNDGENPYTEVYSCSNYIEADEYYCVDFATEASDHVRSINSAYYALSDKERKSLDLYVNDASEEEIQRELSISKRTCCTRVSRIRARLMKNPVINDIRENYKKWDEKSEEMHRRYRLSA